MDVAPESLPHHKAAPDGLHMAYLYISSQDVYMLMLGRGGIFEHENMS